MIPFNKINIGDVFYSPWTGSDILYTVVDKDKDSKLIKIRLSYQHPTLPKTFWKKYTDRIFTHKVK